MIRMYAMVCGLTFLRAQAQILPKNEADIKSNQPVHSMMQVPGRSTYVTVSQGQQ